jgi:nitrogen fixation protein FixH
MKLNWGTGIAIFYSLFVLVMVFMVIKSAQNQSHLVQENYYRKDLNYESFRQKRENAQNMAEQVTIQYLSNQSQIRLQFPSDMATASGEIAMYRPSNKFLDKKLKLVLDKNGQMLIPVTKEMAKGLWKIQLDWENENRLYYCEENIVI